MANKIREKDTIRTDRAPTSTPRRKFQVITYTLWRYCSVPPACDGVSIWPCKRASASGISDIANLIGADAGFNLQPVPGNMDNNNNSSRKKVGQKLVTTKKRPRRPLKYKELRDFIYYSHSMVVTGLGLRSQSFTVPDRIRSDFPDSRV